MVDKSSWVNPLITAGESLGVSNGTNWLTPGTKNTYISTQYQKCINDYCFKEFHEVKVGSLTSQKCTDFLPFYQQASIVSSIRSLCSENMILTLVKNKTYLCLAKGRVNLYPIFPMPKGQIPNLKATKKNYVCTLKNTTVRLFSTF